MKLWILILTLILSASYISKKNSAPNFNEIKTERMNIQYAYTILYVKDVPKTMEFYKKGLGFEQKMLTPENDYGELISGVTTIAFASIELGRANFKDGFIQSEESKKPFGIELAFTTQDVQQTMQNAITNGAVLLEDVVRKPWGQDVGYLRDLNGFIIEICTPIQNQE